MEKRIGRIEHMVAGQIMGTGWIEMIPLDMVGSWIHLIDEAMDMGFTLVLV